MGRAFRRETGLPLLIGFALGVSLAAPNLAAAGPTCHGNGTCPNMSPNGRYFSGTLGTMKCRWSAGTGDRLSKVQAFVNGALRFENVWPPPRGPVVFPPQGRPEMPIGYSTTQFPDGTQLTFKTCVWTVNGQYAESTDPTVHYTLNRGYALTNDDPNLQQTSDDRALAASLFMYTANHSSTFGLCGKGTITGTAIPRSTFYHITTHGASDSVGDSYARPGGDPNHWITAAEVTAAIATKGNSDCQFNFVFLDACDTGDGGNTIYGPWNTESYVGWSGVMRDTTPYLHFVQYLYSNLAAQETVADAVRYAKGQPQTAQNAQWFGVGSYQVHHTY